MTSAVFPSMRALPLMPITFMVLPPDDFSAAEPLPGESITLELTSGSTANLTGTKAGEYTCREG